MKITVFGLGYVGCVSAACLADAGHEVTGIDVDEAKVSLINEGRSPIIEPGLEELLGRGVRAGRLRAARKTDSVGELALVCVGTPGHENGSLGLEQVIRAAGDIGQTLRNATGYPVINVRSTVLPGTIEEIIIPLLEEKSGRRCGRDFGVCMNPEFMRETTAVRDFAEPALTIIGANDDRAAARVGELYAKLRAPVERTSIKEAEMVKYACNAFHATKVCFANEIGNISKRFGLDGHRVMGLLCRDDKLNLSAYYLKPGFAFGGSCLPKDLRAILHKAKQMEVETPMLNCLLESNRKQIDIAFNMIRKTGKTRVGVLGLSFKTGTDDLRESPIVALIETLIGKGYQVRIYDQEVSLSKIHGANRRYIEQTIPHISSLMTSSLSEVLEVSEVIVVSKKDPQFVEAIGRLSGEHSVVDLARLMPSLGGGLPRHYEGICW